MNITKQRLPLKLFRRIVPRHLGKDSKTIFKTSAIYKMH